MSFEKVDKLCIVESGLNYRIENQYVKILFYYYYYYYYY